MLTLLSKAIARLPNTGAATERDKAKQMLHKCVSQFQRAQQIPAQLAARYARGIGDVMASHETVAMLSSAVIGRVRKEWNRAHQRTDTERNPEREDCDEDEEEIEPIRVSVSEDGSLAGVSQVDDYWFRSPQLHDLCFYDFVRYVKKVKIRENKTKSDRLGTYERYPLVEPHPQALTHELVQHINPANFSMGKELVPRAVGCAIPRKDSAGYALFMLCHFRPYGLGLPLLNPAVAESEFSKSEFLPIHLCVMENWEMLHECEDERDAERMRKRSTSSKESRVLASVLRSATDTDEDVALDLITNHSDTSRAGVHDIAVNEVLRRLTESGFFVSDTPDDKVPGQVTEDAPTLPVIDEKLLKLWDKCRVEQEEVCRRNRQIDLDPSVSLGSSVAVTTLNSYDFDVGDVNPVDRDPHSSPANVPIPETTVSQEVYGPIEMGETLLDRVAARFELNERQNVAFRIAARRFFTVHKEQQPAQTIATSAPLRMFLTGPGGTGKTHIVKALKEVMLAYACGNRIRYLAPTGTAAALIDGSTIHSGLNIRIDRRKNGKGNRMVGESMQDYSVILGVRKRQILRSEWRHVWFVLMDEISATPEQVFCEVDHALKFAKESLDWFGGINMIISGDFFQYGPVGGSPLYAPITNSLQQSSNELMRRLGRMAYKSIDTVVELVEQKRMESDPEYAEAVKRLRRRECTQEDADLFNSRVIKSSLNPDGIDLNKVGLRDAVVIVNTNLLRESINARKAMAETEAENSPELVLSTANDTVDKLPLKQPVRDELIRMNAAGIRDKSLPGIIPLYEGMPVILRSRNISTELKITNGGQGVIRKIESFRDEEGYTIVKYVLVEFPSSTIQLPGLPRGWYPIQPVKWTFSVKTRSLPDKPIRVSRAQVPVQPAFAVTGHSAQGKTLPAVMLDMRKGGFHAYVGASRPRSRRGLFLTTPISLSDLNIPLPVDLVREDRRLQALAHNTNVRYGFSQQPMVPVPDPENEDETIFARNVPTVHFPTADESDVIPKKTEVC